MKMLRSKQYIALALSVGAVAVAGCGSSSSSKTTAKTPAAPSTPATPSTPSTTGTSTSPAASPPASTPISSAQYRDYLIAVTVKKSHISTENATKYVDCVIKAWGALGIKLRSDIKKQDAAATKAVDDCKAKSNAGQL